MKMILSEREYEKVVAYKNHHRKIVWMHYVNFFLGIWLITGSFSFRYDNQLLLINDLICGTLVCIFSLVATNPQRLWAPWSVAIIGLWLNISPVLFWARSPVVYYNEIFTGLLLLVFAFVAPGIPGMKLYEEEGPDIPPGWTVNPSSWTQRAPIIFLGWIGFFTSKYLAAYQLGHTNVAWDPFFGKGTENVLNSEISKSFPVSDAALGSFSYMLDAMMAYIGGENRWRTMPWIVILFGILIIPLGAVSIILVILQPLAVGAWCSVCLFTAIVMLIMIPCTFDEVFASLEFLRKSRKEGRSVWKTFWKGGTLNETSIPFITHDFTLPFHRTLKAMFHGLLVPWNLLLLTFIGLWLMFAPAILNYQDALADSDRLIGALIITFSVIAMGEVVRIARFINILFGIWITMAPFILGSSSTPGIINALLCGILIIILSIRRGKVHNRYGTLDRFIV